MVLFWSWLFHGPCSALKALCCGGTYVRWVSFFVQKRSLWSGSFVCTPFGVVARGFGRPATTPWFRCLRENLKEVTFSREDWGGGDWGVEVGEGRLSHSWDSAATRSAPQVNRCSRLKLEPRKTRPARCQRPRPPSQWCLTQRKQMRVWSIIFFWDLKRNEKKRKRPEETDSTAKISCCQRNNGGIKGEFSPPCVFFFWAGWVFILLADKSSSQTVINSIKPSTVLAAKTNNESDKWEECVLVSRAVLCGHLS